MEKPRVAQSGIWLGGGGELKNLGTLPFGDPLKIFSGKQNFFRKTTGGGGTFVSENKTSQKFFPKH
jgi:hypothetical protein